MFHGDISPAAVRVPTVRSELLFCGGGAMFGQWQCNVELQTNVREDLIITENALTRAFSWLKAPTSLLAYTIQALF